MDFFEFRQRDESRVDSESEDLAQRVIGPAIEVHRHLGPGLPESVYRNALSHELKLLAIEHQSEFPVPVIYKGEPVGLGRIDILVAKRLVLELKAVESLNAVHKGQVIAYRQAMDLRLGLLINFNMAILKDGIKRVINTYQSSR